MSAVSRVLTDDHLAKLARGLELLGEANEIIQSAKRCEINCDDWDSVNQMLRRKAQLLLQEFGPKQ